MVGKWLGCIQPMCSAPGAFPPGAFFRQKSAPFHKKCLFGSFYDKTSFFIIKRPDPFYNKKVAVIVAAGVERSNK